jgi:uncharacterized protein
VNASKYPLRINVGFLLNQPIGSNRDIHFEFPEIVLKPDFHLKELKGVARISRTPQGLLVQSKFVGTIPTECVRCLVDFPQTLHAEFDELYAFDNRFTTESGLILPEDANIDLEPLVREYLLIEVPISTLCKEDCKGLCTFCGINLNEEMCKHDHFQEEEP